MIGIKTQKQRYLSLFLDIEKLMSDLPSTSLKCLLMTLPNQRMQRNGGKRSVCAYFASPSADTPAVRPTYCYGV